MFTRVKTEQEIESMRQSGSILAHTLKIVASKVGPGISTKQLADIARKEIVSQGGKPAFLNYGAPTPFPDVICISVNDEVVHGIPKKDRILKDGDIVSLDLGVSVNGMITDSAITVVCGESTAKKDEFLAHTRKALDAGLKVIKHGCRVGDISYAIEKYLARFEYGVVRDLVGHGVGHEVHEDPNIPNYGRKGTGPQLVRGMTLAIEPMATLGNWGVHTDKDGWTIKTNDGSFAAHFEHTILITDTGCEVLTK
jgi:methionyl aminopeptidase